MIAEYNLKKLLRQNAVKGRCFQMKTSIKTVLDHIKLYLVGLIFVLIFFFGLIFVSSWIEMNISDSFVSNVSSKLELKSIREENIDKEKLTSLKNEIEENIYKTFSQYIYYPTFFLVLFIPIGIIFVNFKKFNSFLKENEKNEEISSLKKKASELKKEKETSIDQLKFEQIVEIDKNINELISAFETSRRIEDETRSKSYLFRNLFSLIKRSKLLDEFSKDRLKEIIEYYSKNSED